MIKNLASGCANHVSRCWHRQAARSRSNRSPLTGWAIRCGVTVRQTTQWRAAEEGNRSVSDRRPPAWCRVAVAAAAGDEIELLRRARQIRAVAARECCRRKFAMCACNCIAHAPARPAVRQRRCQPSSSVKSSAQTHSLAFMRRLHTAQMKFDRAVCTAIGGKPRIENGVLPVTGSGGREAGAERT